MANTHQHLLKQIKERDVLNGLYRTLEELESPADRIEQLYPAHVLTWKAIAATQSVPWIWVLICELSLTSFLCPTAILLPVNSLRVFSVLWLFFLHPGSTQTSGLLRLYSDVYDGIELDMNADRRTRRAAHAKAAPKNLARRARSNPYAGDIKMTLPTGSLERVGLNMSQPQNTARSCGFMPEGKRFIRWLDNESSINEAIVTELFERYKWDREVLNQDRCFTNYFPYLSVCGALHFQDVAKLFSGDDPLGLLGRLSFVFTTPEFVDLEHLEAANALTNPIFGHLEQSLAVVFRRIHEAHSCDWTPADQFTRMKGYPFRIYRVEDDAARQLLREKFDLHVKRQRETYLQDHDQFKLEGKAKTRNLRFALPFYCLDQARRNVPLDAWSTSLDSTSLTAANVLGEYLDRVRTTVKEFTDNLLRTNTDVVAVPHSLRSAQFFPPRTLSVSLSL